MSRLRAWLFPENDRDFLFRWMGISLLLHVVTAWFSVGYHSADEQFQILEFLAYKLGKAPQSALAVEYGERMRPWLQPAIYYGITRFWQMLGIDSPFFWAFCFRLFTGALGWLGNVGLALCARFWFDDARTRRWVVLLLALLWFIPVFHVRPSSESLGSSGFILGASLMALALRDALPRGLSQGWAWALAGACFGLSFEGRFQMALMIAGAGAWLLWQRPRMQAIGQLLAGFACVFALGRLADHWGYGDWSFSPWNYVSYNLIRGEVSRYGHEPWWDFLRMSWTESWPVLGFLVAVSSLIAWARNPRHLLTWAQVPFFLVHELIAHKELRFFFPIAAAAPVLIPLAYRKPGTYRLPTFPRWFKPLLGAWVALNLVGLVALAFVPFARTVQFYEGVSAQIPSGAKSFELYTLGRDPYEVLATPIYFYRPEALQVKHVSTYAELGEIMRHRQEPLWFFSYAHEWSAGARAALPTCTLVYRTIPGWILQLNLFDWVSRANIWSIYRCQPSG